jgi:hypothetical protein
MRNLLAESRKPVFYVAGSASKIIAQIASLLGDSLPYMRIPEFPKDRLESMRYGLLELLPLVMDVFFFGYLD